MSTLDIADRMRLWVETEDYVRRALAETITDEVQDIAAAVGGLLWSIVAAVIGLRWPFAWFACLPLSLFAASLIRGRHRRTIDGGQPA